MHNSPGTDPLTEELRGLMRAQWGDEPFKAADVDRMLRLFGLAEDPYHAMAFGEMTVFERFAVIANHQMEACDWTNAHRTVAAMDRIERRFEQAASARARAKPEIGPVEPRPPAPEPTPRERYLQLRDARRDVARARAGKPPFPRPQATQAPTPANPPRVAATTAASLPFT